jgi:cyclic pyranopterin phosphate synthase
MRLPEGPSLRDIHGRTIDRLRVSITDRCDFRCLYCMPSAGAPRPSRPGLLGLEDIERLVRIGAALGLRKVRLTGGEPLLREGLPGLVRRIAAIDGIDDISLTTNGSRLAEMAGDLAAAGLHRINVSLDSLERGTYRRITGRDGLAGVLRGIDAALRIFHGPVKVSCVLLRGVNEGEVEAFAALARRTGAEVRFIEFMPVDGDRRWRNARVVPGDEVRKRIERAFPIVPEMPRDPGAPSRDYAFADGAPGKVGFIDAVTHPFCGSCSRLRITADGKLRTCLFSTRETDLRSLLLSEADDGAIAAAIRAAAREKEAGHGIGRPGFSPAGRSMSQIGG